MAHHEITINSNLSDTLIPTLKIFRFMGLCPTTHQNGKLAWSRKLYMLNFVTITVLASWGIWGFVNDMTAATFLTLGFRGTIDFFLTSLAVSDIIGSAFYFVVSTGFKSENMMALFEKLNQIDEIIKPIFGKKVRNKSIFVSGFVLIFMVVLYIADLFVWGNDSWSGLNNYFGYYILVTVDITQELLYWHLNNLIYNRVLRLNIKIRNLHQKGGTTRIDISNIIKVYDCVSDVTDTLNTCFADNSSIIILSCYIHLITCPYILLVMMSTTLSLLSYVYFVWISVHICRLLMLANVCHRCEHLIGKTSSLIFKLLTCPLDGDVRKKVKMLAFRITKRKISFSSYGLTKINRNLILSVISSISAYWMIVIQFTARLET